MLFLHLGAITDNVKALTTCLMQTASKVLFGWQSARAKCARTLSNLIKIVEIERIYYNLPL